MVCGLLNPELSAVVLPPKNFSVKESAMAIQWVNRRGHLKPWKMKLKHLSFFCQENAKNNFTMQTSTLRASSTLHESSPFSFIVDSLQLWKTCLNEPQHWQHCFPSFGLCVRS